MRSAVYRRGRFRVLPAHPHHPRVWFLAAKRLHQAYLRRCTEWIQDLSQLQIDAVKTEVQRRVHALQQQRASDEASLAKAKASRYVAYGSRGVTVRISPAPRSPHGTSSRSGRAKSRRKAAAKAKASADGGQASDEAKSGQDEQVALPSQTEIPTLRAFLLLLSLLTQDLNTALGTMRFEVGSQLVNGAEGAVGWLHEEYELLFLLFQELRAFTRRDGKPVRALVPPCCASVHAIDTQVASGDMQNATALRDRLHVLYVLLRLCPLIQVSMEMMDHLWEGLKVSSVGRECFYQWLRRAGAGVTRADDDVLQVRLPARTAVGRGVKAHQWPRCWPQVARAIGMAGNPAWETDEAWAACAVSGVGGSSTFGFGTSRGANFHRSGDVMRDEVCVIGPVLSYDIVNAVYKRMFEPEEFDATTLGPQGYTCFQV